jgi:hypothetical protein
VEGSRLTVITDGDPRVYALSAPMTRKVVTHIANKHGVPTHLFWKPEMVLPGGNKNN